VSSVEWRVDGNRENDMRKKITVLTLCAMLFALSVSAQAQQTGKIPRIGFLDNSTASGSAVLVEAFRQELSKLGWNEAKNFTIEYRFAEQKRERVPELAAELVRLKVDLIVATTTPSALVAKSATTTIPIVMVSAADPVSAGLVASLARPAGNVTGLSALSTELDTKRLEILKDAVPKLVRVGFLRFGRRHRTRRSRTERSQARGFGTEAKTGGDRNSIRPQKFRERL
jgi:putative ABC transport system substrate-binding protein